jgi:hypothetical protein
MSMARIPKASAAPRLSTQSAMKNVHEKAIIARIMVTTVKQSAAKV